MNKGLKIALIVIPLVIVLFIAGIVGIVFFVLNSTANANEYSLGDDVIPSIKAVVGQRDVSYTESSISNGITTEIIKYTSETVFDDLLEYVTVLMEEEDFVLIEDMDLNVSPGTVEMAKESKDDGEIIILTIKYNKSGYTLTFEKGEGELDIY